MVLNFTAGAAIDLSSLSVVQGKVCWDLYIDGLVVSSDGNILDALGAAIKVYSVFLYSFYLIKKCNWKGSSFFANSVLLTNLVC